MEAERLVYRDQEGDVLPGATAVIPVAWDTHAHDTPQSTLKEMTEWDC